MVERRQPEPRRATKRSGEIDIPERRLAAVPLQRRCAGHRGQQDEAAVPLERRAGRAPARQSRRRRVLAGAPPRGTVRTKKVTSLELTEMYLARLHRYNATLNNVVTFLDDVARAQAKQADAEIAAGKYRGPLHGIPWGAKDIISVKGYKTTWGTASLEGPGARLRRERGGDAARRRRRADREAHDRRARVGRQLVRRTDEEPVGSGGRIEWIVGRPVLGDRGRVRRLRHRHGDQRIDSHAVGAMRRHRTASDVRPHQPLRRDGALVDAGSARADLPLRRGLRHRHAGDREAGRTRHERVRRAVQLGRADRRPEAARRHHQGIVRQHLERGREEERAAALDTLKSLGVGDASFRSPYPTSTPTSPRWESSRPRTSIT